MFRPSRVPASCASRAQHHARIGVVPQHRHDSGAWRDFTKDLNPLSAEFGGQNGGSCHVAAGMREAGNDTGPHGITDSGKNDRDGRGRILRRQRRGRAERRDQIHLRADQLRGQSTEAIELSLRPSDFQDDIAPLDVTQFPHSLPDRIHERLRRRAGHQYAHASDLSCLLGHGVERPASGTDERKESEYHVTPVHPIPLRLLRQIVSTGIGGRSALCNPNLRSVYTWMTVYGLLLVCKHSACFALR